MNKAWSFNNFSLLEGIKYIKGENESIEIDWDNDSDEDIVKIANPTPLKTARLSNIPTVAGYKIERAPDRSDFIGFIKNWGAITNDDLKTLVSKTFPQELVDKNVTLLFVTGSSSPMSANTAEVIKELYYPNAKIIDVMKANYGVDPWDAVDMDKYEAADPMTKKEMDTFMKKVSPEWNGQIKKSAGLRSGSRRLLKPGHQISNPSDSYIITNIVKDHMNWIASRDSYGNMSAALKQVPHSILIDDLIIEGSTMRGIFNQLIHEIKHVRERGASPDTIISNLSGYSVFSYGKKHTK